MMFDKAHREASISKQASVDSSKEAQSPTDESILLM